MPDSVDPLGPAQLELLELAARLFQRLGLPRSTGQIYGTLFSSPRPLSLDDIAEVLSISKTSASTGTRQLVTLHMIRQVWQPGERKDFFEARTDLREVLRANYHSFVKPRLDQVEKSLGGVSARLKEDLSEGRVSREAHAVTQARLERLGEMHRTLKRLLPLAEKLF
ncbi:MAG: hypothetical protein IT580_02830 [Verrucomicrobiales bacterium]|jgi:DNA-binding transcriptional regulator GbsR (MarR family)|nr:hypothetical protein [Verrucomicrobiales bacterium]